MNTAATNPDGSGWYEIRLQGRLDPRWSARFDGMTLTAADGHTLIAGPVVDQAALHGLLHQLRDIGLPLLSFGGISQVSATSFFLTLPIAAWELSIGLWMTFKGSPRRPSLPSRSATAPDTPPHDSGFAAAEPLS